MGQVEEKRYLKPKLGKTVYCIYNDSIFQDEVGYIGTDSFIVESFGGCTYEDSWEWYYDQYNDLWFTSLAKAKKRLREALEDQFDRRFKIVQVDGEYWEAEEY